MQGRLRSGPAAARALLAVALTAALTGCGVVAGTAQPPAADPSHSGTPGGASGAAGLAQAGRAQVIAAWDAVLRPLPASTPEDLTALQFLNASDGWVGAPDLVGRTVNGGAAWIWHAVAGFTPSSIAFATAQVGWLAGTTAACAGGKAAAAECDAVVLGSTDGGATWTEEASALCGISGEPCGAGEKVVTAGGTAWALLGCGQGSGHTCASLWAGGGADGWRDIPLPSGFQPSDLALVSADEGWLAGVTCAPGGAGPGVCPAALLHTTDDGRSWTAAALPDPGTGGGLLSFADAEHGWFVPAATDCTMGGCWHAALATADGGRTWAAVPSTYGRSGFQQQILLLPGGYGWAAVGAGAGIGLGAVAMTADGGRTWSSAGDAQHWSIVAVAAPSPADVWALGSQKLPAVSGGSTPAFLVHSADGGRTWAQVLPVPVPTDGIDFVSGTAGFGIGTASDPGAVLQTADGGAHWSLVATQAGTDATLTALSFTDAQDGWAAGWTAGADPDADGAPVLLRTADGGRIWTVARRPPDTIMGLDFFKPDLGWLVTTAAAGGGTPAVLQSLTASAGAVTASAAGRVPVDSQLLGVGFASAAVGWALDFDAGGDAEVLQMTADGGADWSPAATFADPNASAAFPSGATSGWVVRPESSGTLLAFSSDGGQTWVQYRLAGLRNVAAMAFAGDRAWLLAATGIWTSQDGGEVWSQVA